MTVAKKKKIFDGRYEILSIVGRGSRSVVYHARHVTGDQSEVALKVLMIAKDDPQVSDRLRKEALAMVSSRHEFVIRLDDFHSMGDLCYLAMEYAPEADLRKYTQKFGPTLPWKSAEVFVLQVADALNFIHKAGMLHRDIKPDNILVVDPAHIRLGDFGVAILPGERSSLEELQKGVGTMNYMAPEVLQGQGYDQRSDIYALGVTFYEILTGEHPFEKAPLLEQIEIRRDGNFPNLASKLKDAPRYLTDALMRALRFAPEDRFPTAHEFEEAVLVGRKQRLTAAGIDPFPAAGQDEPPMTVKAPESKTPESEERFKLVPGGRATTIPMTTTAAPEQMKGTEPAREEETPPEKMDSGPQTTAPSESRSSRSRRRRRNRRRRAAERQEGLEPKYSDSTAQPESKAQPEPFLDEPELEEEDEASPFEFLLDEPEEETPKRAEPERFVKPEPYIAPEPEIEPELDPEPEIEPELEPEPDEPEVEADASDELEIDRDYTVPDRETLPEKKAPEEKRKFPPFRTPQMPSGSIKRVTFTAAVVVLLLIVLPVIGEEIQAIGRRFLKINISMPFFGSKAPEIASLLPTFEGGELTFPLLPAGIYTGKSAAIISGEEVPLTLISLKEQDQLVVIVGVPGWQPAVISRSQLADAIQENGVGELEVVSNGLILYFAGEDSKGKLIGTVKNAFTGEEGAWSVHPVGEGS